MQRQQERLKLGYSINLDHHAPEGMTKIEVRLEEPDAILLFKILKDVKDNFLQGNQSESIQIYLTINPKTSEKFTFENRDIGAIKDFLDENSKVKFFLNLGMAKVVHEQLEAMLKQEKGRIVVSGKLPQTDFFKTQPGAGDEKKPGPSAGLGGQRKQ